MDAKLKSRGFIRLLLVLVCGGLLASCAGRLPPRYDIQNSLVVDASFDAIWPEVIAWFATNNLPIATIERESGIIATDQLAETTGQYMDCGDAGYGYRYGTPEVRFNIFVRRLSANSTDLRITLTGQVGRYGSIGATQGQFSTRTCNSIGRYESQLFEYLQEQLEL